MFAIVASARPDIVFHLASLFLSEHTADQLESLITSNVLFGTQLVEAMMANGVPLLVNTGTSWEHYCNSAYSPVNLYAASKHAFESILQYYVEAKGLQAITLKLFDTYGPDDPRPKLFTLLRRIADEQKTLGMSPGEQMIDLMHVDDVVEAFVLSADRLLCSAVEGHERYAVSSGAPIRLRDLVELFGRVIGRPLPIEWGGRPYREREVMVPWNTGVSVPGWLPTVGLEEGIGLMEKIEQGGRI
jgi:nucleoside-diphosphate-sugar epimerase